MEAEKMEISASKLRSSTCLGTFSASLIEGGIEKHSTGPGRVVQYL